MKALSVKTQNKGKQMKVTMILIIVIVVLLGAVFVIRSRINIEPKALGSVCINPTQCFFQPRPDWENITKYTINLYEDGNLVQTSEMTQKQANDQVNAEGYVVINFPSTHQGSTYKCQVEVANNCGKAVGENSDICQLPEPTPTQAPTSTPPPSPTPTLPISGTPTPTPSISTTPTPTSATPTITPGGPSLTPSPTITPGGPTLTPSPTPSDIIIVKATNTPTPGGPTSVSTTTPTTTGVTQIPSVGFITPTLVILFIGIIAILIPLFI